MTAPHVAPRAVACAGKVGFQSFAIAKDVADRPKKTESAKGRQPYKCMHCTQWHLGGDPGRIRSRNARRIREARRGE